MMGEHAAPGQASFFLHSLSRPLLPVDILSLEHGVGVDVCTVFRVQERYDGIIPDVENSIIEIYVGILSRGEAS